MQSTSSKQQVTSVSCRKRWQFPGILQTVTDGTHPAPVSSVQFQTNNEEQLYYLNNAAESGKQIQYTGTGIVLVSGTNATKHLFNIKPYRTVSVTTMYNWHFCFILNSEQKHTEIVYLTLHSSEAYSIPQWWWCEHSRWCILLIPVEN